MPQKSYCQKNVGSGVTFHHACVTQMIHLASQNNPGDRKLEMHQRHVSQSE